MSAAAADTAALAADHALAVAAVRHAGDIALGYFRNDVRQWRKHGDSLVTEADIAVNDHLHRALAVARPDYGWLSEETEDDRSRLLRPRVWVVDPIDGTRAFAAGTPHFCISVALVEAGRPRCAVLFNPASGEFFEATAGSGARCNGRPIRVSARETLAGCRMAAYAPMFKHPAWRQPWPEMEVLQRDSVAYRLALVACGEADAALGLNTKNDWDLAAADLIVQEAGGIVSAHDGAPLVYNRVVPRHRSFLAAGPRLYDALFTRVSQVKLRA
ncbi:MAG TPA: 3'(2'),5'-bisphosphate nucleotidase CysQ [Candidatus Sulfotelmatobacter sp.]|nr:3'(2'),5'-bisphosphate nucleotidase CysQ [Candidatus Sulfotelmatobacter sp.]